MSRNSKDLRQLIFMSHLAPDDEDSDNSEEENDIRSHLLPACSLSDNIFQNYSSFPDIQQRKCVKSPSCPQLGPISSVRLHNLLENMSTSDFEFSDAIKKRRPQSCEPLRAIGPEYKNFDSLLSQMIAKNISKLLIHCSQALTELNSWCILGDNFLYFANFWLEDLPSHKKLDIFIIEYNLIKSKVRSAIVSNVESKLIPQHVLRQFISAILPEYPQKLFSFKGSYLFLNYLDILISGRTDEFRELLSKVHCLTNDKEYLYYILGIRAYAIINMWFGVVNFFRYSLDGDLTHPTFSKPNQIQIFRAVELGYLEVVTFLLDSQKVNSLIQDSHQRTLVMAAVLHNQPVILRYLLSRDDVANANECAASGNTPLHVAVSQGQCRLLQILLECPKVNVNCCNPLCDDATPLHVAITLGDLQMVKLLLEAGADLLVKMANKTIWDLAVEAQNDSVLTFLQLLRKGKQFDNPVTKENETLEASPEQSLN